MNRNKIILTSITCALLLPFVGCSQNNVDTVGTHTSAASVSHKGSTQETITKADSNAEVNDAQPSAIQPPVAAQETKEPSQQAVDQAYKVVFSIIKFTEEEMNAEGAEEIGSDVGFYLMEAHDELVDTDINFITGSNIEDTGKLAITVDGENIKYIDGNALRKDDCCGVVVAQNGKDPQFISIAPGETATKIKAYFAE